MRFPVSSQLRVARARPRSWRGRRHDRRRGRRQLYRRHRGQHVDRDGLGRRRHDHRLDRAAERHPGRYADWRCSGDVDRGTRPRRHRHFRRPNRQRDDQCHRRTTWSRSAAGQATVDGGIGDTINLGSGNQYVDGTLGGQRIAVGSSGGFDILIGSLARTGGAGVDTLTGGAAQVQIQVWAPATSSISRPRPTMRRSQRHRGRQRDHDGRRQCDDLCRRRRRDRARLGATNMSMARVVAPTFRSARATASIFSSDRRRR